MRGVNKVILVGRLGSDPELRTFQGGGCVCNFRIATSESWKDKQTGEWKERTEWHSISCYGRTAENANEYLRKGSSVYVEGSLHTRKWQDKQGNDRYTTQVNASNIQYLDTKGGRGSGSDDEYHDQRPRGGGQRPSRQQAMEYPEYPDKTSSPPDDFDDDIPF